jgi:hypothetical protein
MHNHLHLEVLRRPVESAQNRPVQVRDRRGVSRSA